MNKHQSIQNCPRIGAKVVFFRRFLGRAFPVIRWRRIFDAQSAMNRFVLAAALFSALALTALSQTENCGFGAAIEHRDPSGLNVRSGPSVKSKIIGNLKFDEGDDDEIVMVTVVGYSNGWAKISSATTVGGAVLFERAGWVTAKAVVFRTERPDGNSSKAVETYSRPSKSSRVTARIPDGTGLRITGFSCFGPKVTHKGKTGWLSAEDLCGNPVTTCA